MTWNESEVVKAIVWGLDAVEGETRWDGNGEYDAKAIVWGIAHRIGVYEKVRAVIDERGSEGDVS